MNRMRTTAQITWAALAVMAMLGATGAAAATKFTASKVGAKLSESTLKGHVFTLTGSQVQCTEVSFAGATEGTETIAQSVVPAYAGCNMFGFANGTFKNENCSYRLTANGETHLEPVSGTSCKLSLQVNVPFIAKCTVTIPNQTVSSLSFSNSMTGVRIGFNLTGMKFKVDESTGACPLSVGEHTTGSYTAESEFTAEGTTFQAD